MENIVLADCKAEEMQSFMKGINTSKVSFELKTRISNYSQNSKIENLRRYFEYFFFPFQIFCNRKKYGVIIGWQQFYALVFCFWCAVFHVKKVNTVIAVNYTYKQKKGKLGKIYRWFMNTCLSYGYLDYIHVPSNMYADYVAKEFGYDRRKIIVTPFGIDDEWEKDNKIQNDKGCDNEKYFLAIGRSNRDYDFLIQAWKRIDCKLVIASDRYNKKVDNKNIIIMNNVTPANQLPLMVNCKAIIIPIDDSRICSGDTVILQGMSLGQIVLVTTPSTIAEMYINDKENGLMIEKTIDKFKCIVDEILEEKYEYIRTNARRSFLEKYSREAMAERLINELKI